MGTLPLTLEQADSLIRQQEEHRRLLRFTADGWSLWPLVRQAVSLRLNGTEFSGQSAPRVGATHLEVVRLALRDLGQGLHLPRRDLLVVSVSSNRSELNEQGLYEDVFFDRLLARLPSFYKLEHIADPESWKRNRKAWFPSGLTTSLPRALATVLPNSVRVDEMARELRDAFGEAAPAPAALRRLAGRFVWRKRLLKPILRRLRPKVMMLVTAYSDHATVAAARELGIRVIELQHGAIYTHHPGYSWTAASRPFRDRMPVPDGLFLYGSSWREQILPNGFFTPEELMVVGSLRMNRYREQDCERETDLLGVTTQGLDTENLLAFLARVQELEPALRLAVKLHPIDHDLADRYRAALPRAQVIGPSQEPSTFALLQRCGWHASISSTCHYEALGLGCPTLVLPLLSADWSYRMLDGFQGVLCPHSPEELVAMVKSPPPPTEAGGQLFADRAVERMLEALRPYGIS